MLDDEPTPETEADESALTAAPDDSGDGAPTDTAEAPDGDSAAETEDEDQSAGDESVGDESAGDESAGDEAAQAAPVEADAHPEAPATEPAPDEPVASAPPRRRRRAAARPAAPPAALPEVPSGLDAEPAAPAVPDDVAVAEAPGADLPTTGDAAADAGVSAEPAPARRRRRAASRPAGAVQTPPAVTDEAAGRGEPAVTDEAAGRGEPAVTDEAAGRQESGTRRRRAARRPAAPPPADTTAADTTPDAASSDAAAPDPASPDPASPDPATADTAGGDDEPVIRGRRRRSRSRGGGTSPDASAADALAEVDGGAAVAPVEESVDATSSATEDGGRPTFASTDADGERAPAPDRAPLPPVAVTFQPPVVVSDDGDEEPGRRRRRRASRAAAPAAQLDDDSSPREEPGDDEGDTGAGSSRDDDRSGDDDGEGEGGRSRRRRRGRRGRGRARDGGDADGSDDADGDSDETDARAGGRDEGQDADDEDGADADRSDDSDEDGGDGSEGSGTRRRRRRRRRGESADGGESAEPAEAAPRERKEREPREPRDRSRSRATSEDDDGVRGITGSTRMEAKRQRRREGRDSGRRRAPIVSEAEFLARRESVERVMLVRDHHDRTQVAVLEDGVLVEHYVTQGASTSYAGNIYLGKVQNVLPSMEAAFIDIGKGRNGVLYAGEVNWDSLGDGQSRRIESALKSGQDVLVQVSKDPIGHKGARLTSQISLPGRYLVYVPGSSMTGISRKLPDTERARLKSILKKVVPEDGGVIVRTAAEGASESELTRDVERLVAQWQDIQAKAAKGKGPALLYGEPDLVVRVVRDVFNEDFTSLVVQGDSEWETVRQYVEWVAPDLLPRLSKHTGTGDLFADHRVDEQLAKALDRKVWLPSGGSLVIDRTEAMVVIDVNTGKFVGKGSNLEETVTKNNLEAAEEIVRQCRLRDLGGIIVIDFIDMVLESNRELVLRRLTECLGRDRTKHQVAEVTSLGLVQMTRKRVGQGLLEAFSEPCSHCNGRGIIVSTTPTALGTGGAGGGGGGRGNGGRGRAPLPAPPPGVQVAPRAGASPTPGGEEETDPVEASAQGEEAVAEAPDTGGAPSGSGPVEDAAAVGAASPDSGSGDAPTDAPTDALTPAALTDADVALPGGLEVPAPVEPAVDAPDVVEAADVVEPATLTPAEPLAPSEPAAPSEPLSPSEPAEAVDAPAPAKPRRRRSTRAAKAAEPATTE